MPQLFGCFFSLLLIGWPVCCVMCSYKFSQYDPAASILLFMKCISSPLQAQAGVNFSALPSRRGASGAARRCRESRAVRRWLISHVEVSVAAALC